MTDPRDGQIASLTQERDDLKRATPYTVLYLDLEAHNAELTASNARLRKALESIRAAAEDISFYNDDEVRIVIKEWSRAALAGSEG